jgi:hypothetical protein
MSQREEKQAEEASQEETVETKAATSGEEGLVLEKLSQEERERLGLIVELMGTREQPDYGKRQEEVAKHWA